jgi:hypothetical protein
VEVDQVDVAQTVQVAACRSLVDVHRSGNIFRRDGD